MKKYLNKDQIDSMLSKCKQWRFESDQLKKTYRFESFREAIEFVVRISHQAEEQDHHPEIYNCYDRVEISMSTHDAGNKVTKKDFELARAIDSVC
jgi:4a-hydroxytetrahydrobiopterin dehydratase